jgi:hypothetical protein
MDGKNVKPELAPRGVEGESGFDAELGACSNERTEAPEQTQLDKERWNYPQINAYRFAVTLYSFIIMGMNDAVIGVCWHELLIRKSSKTFG